MFMKNILLTLITITAFSCKSQIIPQNNAYVDIPQGAYIKDTQNFLDNFVGTWQYQNGNEQFTITFAKELHHKYTSWYEDILYGEYKYIDVNGNTIINTLPNINIYYSSKLYHQIAGATSLVRLQFPSCPECNIGEYKYVNSSGVTLINTLADMTIPNFLDPLNHQIDGATSLVRLQYPPCPECNIGEYRIKCIFDDPDRKYQNLAIVLRSISPTQIKVKLFREGKSIFVDNNYDAPDDMRIPAAEYTMNKI